MNLERIRENNELSTLAHYFQKLEIEAQLLDGTDEFPISTLLLNFEINLGETQSFSLNYVPNDADDFESIKLLQIYAQLPFEVDPAKRVDVARHLLEINEQVLVGSFGLRPQQPLVTFRHTYVQTAEEIVSEPVVGELIMLMLFYIDQFSADIKNLAC